MKGDGRAHEQGGGVCGLETNDDASTRQRRGAGHRLADTIEAKRVRLEGAAAYFKKAVDQPGWQKQLDAARTPLGKLISRTLKSAKYATSLPGAPDGEYVVIQFDTSFQNKQSAVETVTPMKEPDGRWRVSGYVIR